MLKYFAVSGFKNFNHKFSLDFSNVRSYNFNEICIHNELLRSMIVYGKNATGKTNLGLALFDIVSHLTNKNVTPSLYHCYLNADSEQAYAEFEYIFQFNQDIIYYTYRKNEKQKLIYEKLLLNDRLMIEQDYLLKKGSVDGLSELAPTLNWAFQGDESLLKYALNNTALDVKHPLYQMMQFVSSMLWFRTLDENRYIGNKTKSDDYADFIFEPSICKEFEDLLHHSGINENLIVLDDAGGKKRLFFDTKIPLPFFATASSGTKALYTFFYWYKTAQNASFLYIDEFDAYYHYELAESVVMLLEKMQNTQFILTSHNTNLLSNRIMRPDCYFILTNEKLTSLADATLRDLREGNNLEKLYMSGEFDE